MSKYFGITAGIANLFQNEACRLPLYSQGICQSFHITTLSSARAAVRNSSIVLALPKVLIKASTAGLLTPRRLLLPGWSASLLANCDSSTAGSGSVIWWPAIGTTSKSNCCSRLRNSAKSTSLSVIVMPSFSRLRCHSTLRPSDCGSRISNVRAWPRALRSLPSAAKAQPAAVSRSRALRRFSRSAFGPVSVRGAT